MSTGGGPGPDQGVPIGDGSIHIVTVISSDNGTVTAEGLADGTVEVLDMEDLLLTITPDEGYMVGSVSVTVDDFTEDRSWNLSYDIENGYFTFLLDRIGLDMTVRVSFQQESLQRLIGVNFVVLDEHTDSDEALKEELIGQIGKLGIAVSQDQINILDNDDFGDYGTFTFTVTIGTETSDVICGYVVQTDNILYLS
jgi:hypothetical protein